MTVIGHRTCVSKNRNSYGLYKMRILTETLLLLILFMKRKALQKLNQQIHKGLIMILI